MATLQELAGLVEVLRQTIDAHTQELAIHKSDIDKLPEYDERQSAAIQKLGVEQNEQRNVLAITQQGATVHLTELVTRAQNEFDTQKTRIALAEQEIIKLQNWAVGGGSGSTGGGEGFHGHRLVSWKDYKAAEFDGAFFLVACLLFDLDKYWCTYANRVSMSLHWDVHRHQRLIQMRTPQNGLRGHVCEVGY